MDLAALFFTRAAFCRRKARRRLETGRGSVPARRALRQSGSGFRRIGETIQAFVFTHFRAENRFALFPEMR
ncbi:hypothetical protein KYK29_18945 [Shinella daejeonensis]|uniref:hypothetical protein n=1 Tax=Shinella daejeonensis TaxID=659017 RepID=UPI0020C80880|nr:hypothetical protein [Shinella daejeonensis]MCP8897009.1 hypothetical protein [Shinella daejeonensis]